MLHYKVQWRARGNYPGHHPSLQRGGGLQFRNHVPLIDAPDPRRFDVRASLRDPFLKIQVRVYQQPSAIPVYVIADLSASMRFGGAASKAHRVAELVAELSYSAYRTGDPFGFIGCADSQTAPLFLAPTIRRAAGLEIAEMLRATPPEGKSSEGLLKAANLLSARRALVFLVSDFHFSTPLLEQLLASLAYHDLVPVILRDRNEDENLPNFGEAATRSNSARSVASLLPSAMAAMNASASTPRCSVSLSRCSMPFTIPDDARRCGILFRRGSTFVTLLTSIPS